MINRTTPLTTKKQEEANPLVAGGSRYKIYGQLRRKQGDSSDVISFAGVDQIPNQSLLHHIDTCGFQIPGMLILC